jgi:hypothetical protein
MGIVQQKIYTHSDIVHTYNINTETIAHKQYYILYNILSCVYRAVWTVGLFRISMTSKKTCDKQIIALTGREMRKLSIKIK